MRQRGRQGRPPKCALVGEYLWDWFCDIRASVSAKVSPRFVLMKAKQIADQILKEQVRSGCFVPLPVIDKSWLYRWRRDKGVVFRRPNRRYKTSKAVLIRRLRSMWLNVIRIRHFAVRLLGRDLQDAVYGIDEKPLHFNENGSKATRTLEIQGAPSVALKENHAATRERCSVMTSVSSCAAAIDRLGGLPVRMDRFNVTYIFCPGGLSQVVLYVRTYTCRRMCMHSVAVDSQDPNSCVVWAAA